MQGEDSVGSVSGMDDDLNSDEGDPLHDDSILEDLFYKDVSGTCYSVLQCISRQFDLTEADDT